MGLSEPTHGEKPLNGFRSTASISVNSTVESRAVGELSLQANKSKMAYAIANLMIPSRMVILSFIQCQNLVEDLIRKTASSFNVSFDVTKAGSKSLFVSTYFAAGSATKLNDRKPQNTVLRIPQ
jgi:hypothetical protein